jgi:hypothetical protein
MLNHPAYTMGVHDGKVAALRLIEAIARPNSRIVRAVHQDLTTEWLQLGNQGKGETL